MRAFAESFRRREEEKGQGLTFDELWDIAAFVVHCLLWEVDEEGKGAIQDALLVIDSVRSCSRTSWLVADDCDEHFSSNLRKHSDCGSMKQDREKVSQEMTWGFEGKEIRIEEVIVRNLYEGSSNHALMFFFFW
jgi:hypothetical protein